jgi:hypothetical protein
MSPPDELLARIRALQEGVEVVYRQRRSVCVSVWGIKIPVVILLAVTFGLNFGLIAAGELVSPWKTRGQPAVVEPS